MDSFIKNEPNLDPDKIAIKTEVYWALLEKWFTFGLIWSFGATVNEDGRKMIDSVMRDIESIFPHSNMVYDYFINVDKNEWGNWEEKLSTVVWKPTPNQPYHKMQVPTVDSARNKYIL